MIIGRLLKKVLIGLMIIFVLGGCVDSPVLEPVAVQEPYCSDFNEAVDLSGPTLAALEVLKTCTMSLEPDAFTSFVLRYENLLIEQQSEFSNRIFNRGNHETLYELFPESFDPQKIASAKDPVFRSTLIELVNSGYTLRKSENGLYQVELDYSFFDQFKNKITGEIYEYFQIMDRELKTPMFGEEKILGELAELQLRLEQIDRYIVTHPKSIRLKELSEIANEYLLALIYGYEEDDPYDENDVIKPEYYEVYKAVVSTSEDTLMRQLFTGLLEVLMTTDKTWNQDVYDYVISYPEIYMKRYLNSTVYPDAFVDVGFGWTNKRDLYYYPVFSGIPNRAEQGKLNLMSKALVEKRMLGEGFEGMYTGGKYIWSNYELTFNRRNWISIKYDIYVEAPDGSYYWTTESINYDLENSKKLYLNDILQYKEDRKIIDATVKSYFEDSRTFYAVSLESYYKDPNPDFYLTNTGITILIPQNVSVETTEHIVEIFIPFEKFRTSVEYIYKFPHDHNE